MIEFHRLGRTVAAATTGLLMLSMIGPRAASADVTSVETFDMAWTLIHDTFFDPEMNGVDWDGVRDELRPQAEGAADADELRPVLREMIGRLGLSHFELIPGATADAMAGAGGSGTPGIDVRFIDDMVVVSEVEENGSAEEAGVKPGWAVVEIDGKPVEEMVATYEDIPDARRRGMFAYEHILHALSGPLESKTEVLFLDGKDKRVKKKIDLEPVPGEPAKFGNLPTFYPRVKREQLLLEDGTEIGVIGFNIWLPTISASLDDAVEFFREGDGLILDLRGNPGGVGAMAMGLAGHFSSDKSSLGTMTTRDNALEFKINPRTVNANGETVAPFAGPLAVLLDRHSASTTEVFVGGLQSMGRARVFGEGSAGAALPAHTTSLPNGDKLLHAVADFVRPDGERIEGAGITPDVPAPLTRKALLAGEDPALDAALAWIQNETQTRP